MIKVSAPNQGFNFRRCTGESVRGSIPASQHRKVLPVFFFDWPMLVLQYLRHLTTTQPFGHAQGGAVPLL